MPAFQFPRTSPLRPSLHRRADCIAFGSLSNLHCVGIADSTPAATDPLRAFAASASISSLTAVDCFFLFHQGLGFWVLLRTMVAMVASAAASLVRATPSGSGGVQGKRVMQGLMALQAAKLFVVVEARGLQGRSGVASGAARARAGFVREEECEVGAFCPLYSSLRELSMRGGVARSATAANGAVSLNGDGTSGGETTGRSSRKYKKKAAKDSDQPKRPPSAYFIFMETFRKEFKEANPDVKGVTASAKAGGERWISMSEEEKALYVADAAVRKGQYEQAMAAYKNGKAVEDGVQV